MTGLLDRFRPHLRPSFLIIGVQKAGTSALFNMLAQHPGIAAPAVKELHFFDRDAEYARGFRYYLRQFPVASGPAGRITFEATPNYLYHAKCVERVHRHLPGIRSIIVLRDPVARAYSAWNMFRDFKNDAQYAHLYDPRPFEQAVEDELAGRTEGTAHRYIERGWYAGQLRRWFERFGRERVLVLTYPSLKRDPLGTVNEALAWIGLGPIRGDEPVLRRRYNTRPYERSMDPAVRERLIGHFAPYMQELDALLGRHIDLGEER